MMRTETIKVSHPFTLENGEILPELEIAYSIQGDPKNQPIIWVCHALTGNQFVNEWWAGIFGEGKLFSPSSYCIVCANVLGSAYGTSGPLLATNDQKYAAFPEITTKDMVNCHEILAEKLNITAISITIGASIGGQQAVEWASRNSIVMNQLILIATNAIHSPYGRAFNEAQRMAIKADQTFGESSEIAGKNGLKAARAIAMLSYRSYEDFSIKQEDDKKEKTANYKASSYVNYQGEKLATRFNAYSYFRLSQAMDSHNISRGRELSINECLNKITAETLVIGINSDLLFPPAEQQLLAANISNAEYLEMDSPYGHDAFLIEYDWIIKHLRAFTSKRNAYKKI